MVFENVLSMVSSVNEIKKSWFVAWLYGNSEKAFWAQVNHQQTTTWAMTDSINGGLGASTGTIQTRGELNFDNKRHYDPAGLVVEAIFQNVSANNTTTSIGADNDNFTGINSLVGENRLNPAFTFQQLIVRDGVGTTNTSTSVLVDNLVFHRHKIETFAAAVTLHIDGILGATITTTIPTVRLQPFLGMANDTGFAASGAFRYLEIYNK